MFYEGGQVWLMENWWVGELCIDEFGGVRIYYYSMI